jgi:hypothetical protein
MSQCLKKPIFDTILTQKVGTQQFLYTSVLTCQGDQDNRTYLVALLYHNFTILC